MGDAVMERVARVPELPEVETTWVRSDALGNSRRQSQLGGPTGRSASQAMDDANHGAAAGLIPGFRRNSGFKVTVDDVKGLIWVENYATADLGWAVPDIKMGFNRWDLAADILSGGSSGAGRSKATTVAIGLPMSRLGGLSSDGAASTPPDEVAALLGLDFRAWVAAAAVAKGDLWRASELPGGAIVRSANSVGVRGGEDMHIPNLESGPALKLELAGGYATESTVRRVGDVWIADVSLDQRVAGSAGFGMNYGIPGADFGGSGGWTLGQKRAVTLQASANDPDAMMMLSAVLRLADGSTPDPIAAVPGADALRVERERTGSATTSTRFGALMNSLTFDHEWGTSSTLQDGVQGDSASGSSRTSNTARLGFDNALTKAFNSGPLGLVGGIQGEFTYNAVHDQSSMLIDGGSRGETFDVTANLTQVRLGHGELAVILQAAQSEDTWEHFVADVPVSGSWQQLRLDLLAVRDHPAAHVPDPVLAVQITRLRLIASYVASDTVAVEPLLNLLGRGKLARADKAVGVLECWPEGSEATRSLYDSLGQWMELVPRNEWGEHDPVYLLRNLGQCVDRLYGQIESFARVPQRARLEMLGQVLAWRDTIDAAWRRYGSRDSSNGADASHRPSSRERLEHLAGECRSEAAPHLYVLEPLIVRPSEISDEQEDSFEALAGILAYWKVVATDLRRAYADLGIAESSWLLRPERSEPERELDPPLRTWRAIRNATLTTRRRIEYESTYALL